MVRTSRASLAYVPRYSYKMKPNLVWYTIESTEALDITIDGRTHFIGRKGSAYREARAKELSKPTPPTPNGPK